jgi:T5SS/PEP-CTERM-associated repeat protein
LTALNPGESIIIAENAGDVAILNMAISSLSGANASIGRAGGAQGTLNVGGAFNLSGALHVGEFGTGTMNVTGGGTVASANGFIGVNAGSSGQVTVSGANSTWANSNSLTVGGGSGTLLTNARLDVNDGGVVSVTGVLQVNYTGRLAGNALVQGNVENFGRVAPGTSVGTLHINGNYGQPSSSGELQIELAAANSFDKLDIDGNLTLGDGNFTLGGNLNVSLLGGYSPEAGASFDILDWTGTRNGTFRIVQLPPLSGRVKWNTSQLYTSGVLSVVPAVFQAGEFITYGQDDWGLQNTAASQLLLNHFFEVYPNGVEMGIPGAAGYSAVFITPEAVLNYLPTSGSPAPLDNDKLDPTSTDAGVLGGYVLALNFDVDFSDAGHLGTSSVLFGDLVLHDLAAPLSVFNGMSVREFLAEANSILGGGALPPSIDYDNFAPLTDTLTLAFAGGVPTLFAQDHLRFPGDFNGDLKVDAADYVVWRKTDGTPAGYNEWRANFGRAFGSGSSPNAPATSPAVPEPTSFMLLALAGFGLLGVWRRARVD